MTKKEILQELDGRLMIALKVIHDFEAEGLHGAAMIEGTEAETIVDCARWLNVITEKQHSTIQKALAHTVYGHSSI